EVYGDRDVRLLRRFIRDNFEYSLADIGGASPEDWAEELIEKSRSEGWIDSLYTKFCELNPDHSSVADLQRELQPVPLIKDVPKLVKEDLQTLFEHFSPYDFAGVQKAFLYAFKLIYGDLWDIRPDHPPLNDLKQIQSLLETYDNPKLAVQFVEHGIAELRQTSKEQTRDFIPLEAWRDRISQEHNISPENPEPIIPKDKQGYLLVALKESGRVTQEGPSVNVFTELHVIGEANPIEFDATSVTCSLDEVAGHLSNWIRKAEDALIPYRCGRVTLELFLPCVHLEKNFEDEWEVRNEQNRPRSIGRHRGVVVRSLERVLNGPTQIVLSQNWELLKKYVQEGNAGDKFHVQEDCPTPGDLEGFLENMPGLKLVAGLPTDREQRQDILYDIINSAVPIALWSSDMDVCTAAERLTEFDNLLRESCLINFSDLAQKWRVKRTQARNEVIKHLRLLCDCPDRCPNLPDPNRDEDLLVAS
ncbi:MAG: hypothetical protein ACFE0J_16510, partial [Elainellaceae cyanobacterium]